MSSTTPQSTAPPLSTSAYVNRIRAEANETDPAKIAIIAARLTADLAEGIALVKSNIVFTPTNSDREINMEINCLFEAEDEYGPFATNPEKWGLTHDDFCYLYKSRRRLRARLSSSVPPYSSGIEPPLLPKEWKALFAIAKAAPPSVSDDEYEDEDEEPLDFGPLSLEPLDAMLGGGGSSAPAPHVCHQGLCTLHIRLLDLSSHCTSCKTSNCEHCQQKANTYKALWSAKPIDVRVRLLLAQATSVELALLPKHVHTGKSFSAKDFTIEFGKLVVKDDESDDYGSRW